MHHILSLSATPETALTQYRGVKIGTAEGTVTAVTTLGEAILGVAQETITTAEQSAGRIVGVQVLGVARMIAGANLTLGAKVRISAAGKVVALAGTAATTENVVGILLTDPAADGDHCEVLLTPGMTVTNPA